MRGFGSGDSGTYELSLTQIDTDDHGDNLRTATRVQFDDRVVGTVYPGGEDYFEFDVRRWQVLRLSKLWVTSTRKSNYWMIPAVKSPTMTTAARMVVLCCNGPRRHLDATTL